MSVYEVLFVCSGNICRSPYAEGYLRHRLAGADGVRARSAGTLGIHGQPPSAETIELAREAGFDVASLRSKGVTYEAVDEADIILVMEEAHRATLLGRYPEDAEKIHLLSEYHPDVQGLEHAPDIFDPIGLSPEDYRRCFELVRRSIDGLLAAGTVPRA